MKQGSAINRIVMLLFLAAMLAYLGGSAWRGLRDPYPTVQAYTYAVGDTLEATGWLVREEQVLTGSGGIVRLLPVEGEKVHVGATVAMIYADEASLERAERLENLEAEAGQLAAAIDAAGENSQGESSGQAVADAMVVLRSAVEGTDFTRLESQVSAFKSAVYQQAQRYGDAAELSAALAAAQSEIAALRAQSAQDTGRVTVTESGVFSGQVDGYEMVLTPEGLDRLTPSALDALEGRAVEGTGLGKLITNATWYFVCPMEEADARRLTEGGSVTVRFSRDWSGDVNMTVERIGAPENGRVAVVLSSHQFLSDVTLLRRQTVELVFETRSGIRVPTGAVRMEEGQSVVYVQVGVKAEKKPITILAQGEDYYLVEPVEEEETDENQERKSLRAGDLVVIAADEIWDGKIIK